MDRLLKMDLEKHLHRGARQNKSLLIILELQKKISPNTLTTTIIIQIIDNHWKKTQVSLHATVTCTTLKYALYLKSVSGLLPNLLASRNTGSFWNRSDMWARRKGFYASYLNSLRWNSQISTIKMFLFFNFLGTLPAVIYVLEKGILKGKKSTTCHSISKYV